MMSDYEYLPREQLTALDDGGTVHRPTGVDPFPGVAVAEGKPTAFDIAEGIVQLYGVQFAREVAAHVQRWGEWK